MTQDEAKRWWIRFLIVASIPAVVWISYVEIWHATH